MIGGSGCSGGRGCCVGRGDGESDEIVASSGHWKTTPFTNESSLLH